MEMNEHASTEILARAILILLTVKPVVPRDEYTSIAFRLLSRMMMVNVPDDTGEKILMMRRELEFIIKDMR